MVVNRTKSKGKHVVAIALALALCTMAAAYLIVGKLIEDNKPGWHREGKTLSYYVLENGERVRGYHLIDGKAYLFDPDGRIIREKGWYDDQGKKAGSNADFYVTDEGELAKGWKYIEGKVRYFYQKEDAGDDRTVGALARGYTTKGKIHIPTSGYLDGDDGLCLAYGIDVLNRYGWSLESAYKYAASLRFIAGTEHQYGLTIRGCAIQGFKYGEGNCLAWAGTFCVMAKLLGYDCRLIWGTLEWRGIRPHSWAEIWPREDSNDEELRVFDPRKNDGVDMAGFDVRYGSKRARDYILDSRQYLEW